MFNLQVNVAFILASLCRSSPGTACFSAEAGWEEAFLLPEWPSTGRSFRSRLVAEKDPMCCRGEPLKGDALSVATPSISLPRRLQMSSHSISLSALV